MGSETFGWFRISARVCTIWSRTAVRIAPELPLYGVQSTGGRTLIRMCFLKISWELPFGNRSKVPSITIGTTSTPQSIARRNAPSLNGWISPSSERVPSGNSMIEQSFLSQSLHVSIISRILFMSPRRNKTS